MVRVADGCVVCSWAVRTAAVGLLGGVAASVVVPVVGFGGGFIYGVGQSVTMDVLRGLGFKDEDYRMSDVFRRVMLVFNLTVSALVGWAIAVSVGVPLTFTVAIGLTLTMLATMLALFGIVATASWCYSSCFSDLPSFGDR